MKLIVGLGNPGKKYDNTRHNVGFMVLDKLAGRGKWSFSKYANAEYLKPDNKVELLKPRTFMNLSGQAVQYAMQKHKISPQNILIVSDDLDLPLGTIRVRLKGSSGGHKGLDSIINQIGDKFTRMKIGIGNPSTNSGQEKIPSEKYVLAKFSPEEKKNLAPVLDEAVNLLLKYLEEGYKEETITVKF